MLKKKKLLCDFLDDRIAQIKVANYLEQDFPLNCGVPQGSDLSPTLFTIYTSDAINVVRGTNVTYADDVTQIVNYRGRSKEILFRKTDTGTKKHKQLIKTMEDKNKHK